MKKFLSSVLSLALVLSMSTSVFAANITTNGGSNDTLVTYGMNQGFTVTIPADFDIDTTTKKATADVSASNVMIPYGSTLKVTVTGDDYEDTDSWELVDEVESTNMLTYTIGSVDGGNDIVNGSVVLAVDAGDAHDETVTEIMHFTVVDEITKAGTYADTLTFTVSVEGITANTITFIIQEKEWVNSERVDINTTCYAEPDMTWAEWLVSDYNEMGLVSKYNSIHNSANTKNILSTNIQDTIISNEIYYLEYYPT